MAGCWNVFVDKTAWKRSIRKNLELMQKKEIIESFEVIGKVEEVLVAHTFGTHVATPVERINVFIRHGIKGDNHSGFRTADVREKDFIKFGLPKRTEIVNLREFSAVSVEEMKEVTEAMGIPEIPIGSIGENLIISGIPNFTQLPIGTKLFFKKDGNPQMAVLIISGENTPCTVAGEAIQENYPETEKLRALFVKHALGKRGVVGSIFCSGAINKGDIVIARIPRQVPYEVQ